MCGDTCSKCIVLIISGIFMLLGAAALGLGIFVLVDEDTYLEYITRLPIGSESVESALESVSILKRSAYSLCIGGGVIFILSFIGFCGALKKIKCLLYIYSIILILVLAAEVAATVLAFLYWDTVEQNLKKFLHETLQEKYDGKTLSVKSTTDKNNWILAEVSEVSGSWDFAMLQFKCCGVNGDRDFDNATKWTDKNYNYNNSGVGNPFNTETAMIPPACCISSAVDLSKLSVSFEDAEGCISTKTEGTFNTKGCYDSIKDYLIKYAYIVMIVAIVVAILEIILIIATCCLIRSIGKDAV